MSKIYLNLCMKNLLYLKWINFGERPKWNNWQGFNLANYLKFDGNLFICYEFKKSLFLRKKT